MNETGEMKVIIGCPHCGRGWLCPDQDGAWVCVLCARSVENKLKEKSSGSRNTTDSRSGDGTRPGSPSSRGDVA